MIIPAFLKKGDKVGVVATAKVVNSENTRRGIQVLESWGLEVVPGNHLFDKYGQFAGTDTDRALDLQNVLNDQDIRAIFMVRGGYGTTRIIDKIDMQEFMKHPKWICGFSDITALHTHLFNHDVASIHGPMPSFFYSLDPAALKRLRKLVFGEFLPLTAMSGEINRPGIASGRIIGGNLSIICHTIGTSSEIRTKGNILFIEDVGEQLYHLDRMMVQLKRCGKLDEIAGLVVGQFTDMKDDDPFGMTANEIILHHVQEFNYPVAFNFQIGHVNTNQALPVGVLSELSVKPGKAELRFMLK